MSAKVHPAGFGAQERDAIEVLIVNTLINSFQSAKQEAALRILYTPIQTFKNMRNFAKPSRNVAKFCEENTNAKLTIRGICIDLGCLRRERTGRLLALLACQRSV